MEVVMTGADWLMLLISGVCWLYMFTQTSLLVDCWLLWYPKGVLP
jgi:hypothetical protein